MILGGEGIALLQLRPAGGMAFLMADTKVLADERAMAIWEIAAENLFWCVLKGEYCHSHRRSLTLKSVGGRTVQLVSIEMLRTGITLPTAFVGTFKLAIGRSATAAPASFGGLFV